MSRYKIALNKGKSPEDKELNEYFANKPEHSISFISAVDVYNFLSEESDKWFPDSGTPLIISYVNKDKNRSFMITQYNWNKTKHFIPVSILRSIEERAPFFVSKKRV